MTNEKLCEISSEAGANTVEARTKQCKHYFQREYTCSTDTIALMFIVQVANAFRFENLSWDEMFLWRPHGCKRVRVRITWFELETDNRLLFHLSPPPRI